MGGSGNRGDWRDLKGLEEKARRMASGARKEKGQMASYRSAHDSLAA